MTFFQKVHSIQKCSVTQNTVFQCIKNNFLLSNPKLVFFTEFNLVMLLLTPDTLAVTLWSAQEIGGLSKLGVELFIFGYGDYCGKCQEIKLFCYFILAAENIAFIIFAET